MENYRLRGDKSKPPDISYDDRPSTLSVGERAGVRGNGAAWTDAAAQYVFGTRETEPHFLAALGQNVR